MKDLTTHGKIYGSLVLYDENDKFIWGTMITKLNSTYSVIESGIF